MRVRRREWFTRCTYQILVIFVILTRCVLTGQTFSNRPIACRLVEDAEILECSKSYGRPQQCELVNDERQLFIEQQSGNPFIFGSEELIHNDPSSAAALAPVTTFRELVRNCGCAQRPFIETYCPAAHSSGCWVRGNVVQCLPNPQRLQEFSRAIWPFCCVMVLLILSCLLCTRHGQWALCCSCAFFCNRWYAAYLLRHRPLYARQLLRQWTRRRRRALEQRYRELGAGVPLSSRRMWRVEDEMVQEALEVNRRRLEPRKLYLKSRKYDRREFLKNERMGGSDELEDGMITTAASLDSDSDDDVLNDLPTCTICYGPLQDKDRVGDLPCRHVFHTECLKVWLRRRNVCPLCLDCGIAKDTPPSKTSVSHVQATEGEGDLTSTQNRIHGPRRREGTAAGRNQNDSPNDTVESSVQSPEGRERSQGDDGVAARALPEHDTDVQNEALPTDNDVASIPVEDERDSAAERSSTGRVGEADPQPDLVDRTEANVNVVGVVNEEAFESVHVEL